MIGVEWENGKLFGMLTYACVVADVQNWSFGLTMITSTCMLYQTFNQRNKLYSSNTHLPLIYLKVKIVESQLKPSSPT